MRLQLHTAAVMLAPLSTALVLPQLPRAQKGGGKEALGPRLAQGASDWVSAAMLAGGLVSMSLPHSALALPPTAGTWAIEETRAGNKCSATLLLQPQAEDRGAARYQGVCVDSASGSWLLKDTPPAPRLAWRLEYEKSTVFFSTELSEAADGTLTGKGEVFAAPRSDPSALRRVGTFKSRQVSSEWDLKDPNVASRVTDKML